MIAYSAMTICLYDDSLKPYMRPVFCTDSLLFSLALLHTLIQIITLEHIKQLSCMTLILLYFLMSSQVIVEIDSERISALLDMRAEMNLMKKVRCED